MSRSSRKKKQLTQLNKWRHNADILVCMNGRSQKMPLNENAVNHYRHKPYGGFNEQVCIGE